MSAALQVDIGILDDLFPFHLVVDAQLRIVRFGKSLPKLCRKLQQGVTLDAIFDAYRPRGPLQFEALDSARNILYLLKERESGVLLRGQFVPLDAGVTVAFVGSPWFTDVAALEAYGLGALDFAVFDPALDLLQAIQTQKIAVADLRKLASALEQQRAELRRAETEQRELARLAEKASAAKGEFLARMSHEIRTPMNGVIGMLEALLNTPLSGEQLDYLQTAHGSAETLLRLINDILDYSKVEAGKLTLEHIAFDLKSLLEQSVNLWQLRAAEKGIVIDFDCSEAAARWVKGDPARLQQVLANLLNNAIKFTHQGHVTLTLEPAVSANATHRFRVRDSGIGIDETVVRRLFKPFMQEDDSIARRYGGTGLGLAICQQLVTLMNGEGIHVQSTPGVGSSFSFALPFAVPTAEECAAQSLPEMPSLEAGARGSRILVADDNDTNRKVAAVMLERFGLEVIMAEDGLQAVHTVKHGHVDLVLMDCHMPIFDGLEATAAIRRLEVTEQRPRLPIIAVSASAFQEDRDKCRAAGMDDFLAKPVTLAKLTAMLARFGVRAGLNKPSAPTPACKSVSALFDASQLEEIRLVTADGFGDLVAQLQANAAVAFAEIEAAIAAADAERLRKSAHRFKGSASTIGARAVAEISAELERLGKSGTVTEGAELLDSLREVFEQSRLQLQAMLTSSAA